MINENTGTVDHYLQNKYHVRCVSWSAIVVGALIGIGLSFLLNLFSVSIGLSLVKTTQTGLMSLAIGGFIGLLISVFISMFVAGTAAGFLGRGHCLKRNLGVIYGFTSWCLALIIMIILSTHMMLFASNYTKFVTNQATVTATENTNAPTVTTSSPNKNTTNVTVNSEKATNTLGYTAFLVFVLFLVGAIASAFGGHFGMTTICRKHCDGGTCHGDTVVKKEDVSTHL